MASTLKNTQLELLTDNMLLMVEKWIRGGLCHPIPGYAKLITNIWMIMIKIKNHHILNIGM